ncbi:MAG: RNA polymerase recycling motor HelD [Bacillota bacterium]|nr:RNA polymerase recycling motor HelD [Bacillota bacterium]
MPAADHPSYREEAQRCNETLEYVEKSLNQAEVKKAKLDVEVDYAKKHMSSESSQSYIDYMVNATIQGSLALKIRNLLTARSKPYFARVDFKEDGSHKVEKLYIGKMSLAREEDQQIIIVDWRAPISNLYYESRLGEASYKCPGGDIDGRIMLKRQFSINGGKLQEIFDIDITTNDEFLQTYLGASAENRLKEIVSTIQFEQNEIIRADMWTPLVVQGAAGSGKTTIALHRIAYLIYTYEKNFEPENFMIIAPNRLFLNYISEVLPELGVEKVKQTTFEAFAMELMGKKFKIRDADEKLALFLNSNNTPEEIKTNELLRRSSELKTSMVFRDIIDDYIKIVEQSFIPKEDFKIGKKVLFKHEELNRLFIEAYKQFPFAWRINEIKKYMSNRLKVQKDAIINQLQDDCDKKILTLKLTMKDSDERQKLIIEAIDKKNRITGNIEKYSKRAVGDYISKISRLSPFEYYKDFVGSEDIFNKAVADRADQELCDFLREYTSRTLTAGYVEIEDIAPITYLKFKIYGMDEKLPVRHIIIDEAQDFSAFQIYVLKKIVKDSSFTLLGDLCQGIHSYRGIRDWKDVTEEVFDDRRSRFLTLVQSYRTTIEIMEAANKVIGKIPGRNFVTAEPVVRHGDKVNIIRKDNFKDIADHIAGYIGQLKKDGYKSAAVICKTLAQCMKMLALLLKYDDSIYLVTGKEEVYKGGIVVVPAHLSKGLEFDAVMVADADSKTYGINELDAKLLYVAMTRPLHKLGLYFHGEPSPLIEDL